MVAAILESVVPVAAVLWMLMVAYRIWRTESDLERVEWQIREISRRMG